MVLFQRAEECAGEQEKRYAGPIHMMIGMLGDNDVRRALVDARVDVTALSVALDAARRMNSCGIGSMDDYEFLGRFMDNLSERARNGTLDPVIGRDAEIRQVIKVPCRRIKNNPVIVGEPGVGKTAVVEGLAQRIVEGHVPDDSIDHVVVSLDLGALIAGTRFRGEFEERLKKALAEVSDAENVLLSIDEINICWWEQGLQKGEPTLPIF